MKTKKLIGLVLLFVSPLFSQTQNCNVISDDYSDPSKWNTVDVLNTNEITVASGRVNFINSTDGKENRIYRQFPNAIKSSDDWELSVEFNPQSAGVNNFCGHIVASITGGVRDPLTFCNGTPCSANWTPQNQDGIIIMYATSQPPESRTINTYFTLQIKDNQSEWFSRRAIPSQSIYAPLKSEYILELKKCENKVSLRVKGKNSGNYIPGLIVYNIPISSNISDLNVIQHGNSSRGLISRTLSGSVDNLCLRKIVNQPPTLSGFDRKNSTVYRKVIYECEGSSCSKIYSDDPNFGQNLSVNLVSALPNGASINFTSGSSPEVNFCWDPDKNDIGFHTFSLEVSDDYCNSKSSFYNYVIEVKPGFDLGFPPVFCDNDPSFQLPDPAKGGIWTLPNGAVLPNGTFDPKISSPGAYQLKYCPPQTGNGNCEDCQYLNITVLAAPNISISQDLPALCSTDLPIQLLASPSGGVWKGGPYISANGLFDPSKASTNPMGNKVTYSYSSPNRCMDSKTFWINVYSNGGNYTSFDLGDFCSDEFISFGKNVTDIVYSNVYDPTNFKTPLNAPIFPIQLPAKGFHLSLLNSLGAAPLGFIYKFKVSYRTAEGCEYQNEFILRMIDCACDDENGQNLKISATSMAGAMSYSFAQNPLISNFKNVVRMSWVIQDNNGNFIKMLKSWSPSSNQTIFSSFNYNFQSEYGTLFNCGYYNVYLQIVTKSESEELSLCQDYMQIYICDQEGEHGERENESMSSSNFLKDFHYFPNPVTSNLHVDFNLENGVPINVFILDSEGYKTQLLSSKYCKKGLNKFDFDVQEIKKGIGYLIVEGEHHKEMHKIIFF